nr:hypothetical protein [Tanacetum cinerariifolium]
VTWGVGVVNGTVLVRGSARKSLYGGDGVLAGKAVARQLDLGKAVRPGEGLGFTRNGPWTLGNFASVLRVTWGVGVVNGTVLVRGSARKSLYGGDGVLAGKAVARQLDLVKVWLLPGMAPGL